MRVIHKDATVSAPLDDEFPGTFEAILSAPTKDRDGETLLPAEWKQPLPDHITVDMDHEMTVAGTIGSAKPWIDEKGNLRISGRFASTPKAQEVRTLMQEGHVNRTSVAFMSEKTRKDGVSTVTREVLNAAIVAIPSNREAVVLSAKGVKAGARNSRTDAERIQAIYNHAVALGATGGDTDVDEDVAAGKSVQAVTLKNAVADVLARYTDGAIGADEAMTLIRDANTPTDESGDVVLDHDEGADSAVVSDPAAAAKAAAAGTGTAAVEDDSIAKQAAAARFRFYSTLSER